MKKCIISVLCIISLLCSASMPVFADEMLMENAELSLAVEMRVEEYVESKIVQYGQNISTECVKTVKDFAGNEYVVVECEPVGYYIVHPESGIIVEYAETSVSPYIGVEENLYYAGPTYYYVLEEGKYVHTLLDNNALDAGQVKTAVEMCATVNEELLSQENTSVAEFIQGNAEMPEMIEVASSGQTDYWVTDYTWFQNTKKDFGYKSGGYCGYIAANLILKYYNYRGKISLSSTYATTNSTTLTDKLIAIGDAAGYGSGTWAYEISQVLDSFCEGENITQAASWAVGVTGITTEIKTNKRPCILFGDISGAGNHAIIVYGYNSYENPTYYTFICHFGWNETNTSSYEAVHVYGGTSVFGSNTKYKI